MKNIPVGVALPPSADPTIPTGAPDIPDLGGRQPTNNEQVMISGEPVYVGSTNVSSFWWNWQAQRLFVEFLDGSLYAYEGVPLAVAVGMIETDSHGRYVWNVLRANGYAYRRLAKGGTKGQARVIRLMRPGE
jgi:hypothetical protein